MGMKWFIKLFQVCMYYAGEILSIDKGIVKKRLKRKKLLLTFSIAALFLKGEIISGTGFEQNFHPLDAFSAQREDGHGERQAFTRR